MNRPPARTKLDPCTLFQITWSANFINKAHKIIQFVLSSEIINAIIKTTSLTNCTHTGAFSKKKIVVPEGPPPTFMVGDYRGQRRHLAENINV